MAGDYRYGGFSNQELANYLGISVPELQMVQQVVEGQYVTPESMAQAQKFAGESGGGPMGGANRLENIMRGMGYIQEHPLGSKHHGFNPVSSLANFATGGLYGVGKGLASGDPLQAAAAGAAPLSPGGIAPINTEFRGPQSTLISAAAPAIGYGIGEAASAFSTPLGPEGIPYLTDSGGFAGQQVLIDPATGGALPGAGLTPDQLTGLAGAGASGQPGGGTSGLGETALGLTAAQQLAGMLTPQGGGGGMPGAPSVGAPGAATPQRPGGAPSGSELDTPGAGFIDPAYIKRQKGGKNSRGISDQGDLSQQQQDAKFAALYGFSGGM